MPTRLGSLPATDERSAIIEPGNGFISYAELDRLADAVADRLRAHRLRPGARVGLYLQRSTDAIAAMLGTLRAGYAYVPVDPRAPVDRIAASHADCRVQLTLVEARFAQAYADAMARVGWQPLIHAVGEPRLGRALLDWTAADDVRDVPGVAADRALTSDIACLLYTSGTTGRPKAWLMSRRAIEAHASWCHALLSPSRDDVFANHAQFSFGMSLFDIYSSLGCGATLVLVPEEARQHATRIVELLAHERVTIWFSGSTALSLIGQVPDLETRDLSALRAVAFAGDVFPLRQLSTLRQRLRHPRYFNFYGSTETNVALFYELPEASTLEEPPPIGRPCAHYEARVATESGGDAPAGTSGELQLRGAGLTSGYWNQEDSSERVCAAADGGEPWFRTRDLVAQLPTGDFRYMGRLGRMIKLRGYRVEPGEIESRLYEHPSIREAGVVPVEGAQGLELVAHIRTADDEGLSTVALKEFCAVKLPPYMVPARFQFHEQLPRTSSGKIDLQQLAVRRDASTP
ncbi:MAG: amino acid adenylation domain-containing protein [Vicinamibacterales bacterium]